MKLFTPVSLFCLCFFFTLGCSVSPSFGQSAVSSFVNPLQRWIGVEERAGYFFEEQRVDGYFRNNEDKESLVIQRHLEDKPSRPTGGFWEAAAPKEHIEKFGVEGVLSLRFIPESLQTTNNERKPIKLPIEIPPYDYIFFAGSCRSPDTGLDQLLFIMRPGGMSNIDINETFFVYYDSSKSSFETHMISSEYSGEDCSIVAAEKRKTAAKERIEIGNQIFEELRPSKIPLELKNIGRVSIKFSTREIPDEQLERLQKQWEKLNHKEIAYYSWEKGIPRYNFEKMEVEDNTTWEIWTLYRWQMWESWGVVLAKKKGSDHWISFYTVPPGGSREILFLPRNSHLQSNSLYLHLCTDCQFYGEWDEFEINLTDFTISRKRYGQ